MILSRLLIRRFRSSPNTLIKSNVQDKLLRREFKSKNILHHRRGNNLPFFAAVDKVMAVLIPAGLFLAYYDMDYPGLFLVDYSKILNFYLIRFTFN